MTSLTPRPTRRLGRAARSRVVGAVLAAGLLLAACGGDEVAGGDGDGDGAPDVAAACESPSDVAFDRSSGLGALPAARLPDLEDPDTVVCTADWAGTPTVVNFWATWCEFCVEEMPDLQAASEALGDDVRFVGVDVQDVREEARAFLDETGVTYRSVEDRDQGWYGELGNRGMPTTLFVDEGNTVVWRHTGPITTEQVLELVDTHLGVGA